MINYSDFPKIHEDAGNPKNQILSLSHLLENAQQSDVFGNQHTDIADRIFRGWLNSQRENSIKKLIFIKTLYISRTKCRVLHSWGKKICARIVRDTPKSVDFGQNCMSAPSSVKHHPKHSQQTYSSVSDLKNLLSQTSKPLISSMRHSNTNSFYDRSGDDKSALYNRLYEEAAKKKLILEKAQNEEKDKGLEECTFRPEISEYSQRKTPVYDRITTTDLKEREEYYKKQKVEKELEGCTFKPKTNMSKTMSVDGAFDKLYRDAEVQRQKLRAKELSEKDRELVDCTFRPTVLNPSSGASGSVYEKLYKSYQDSQREKRRVEYERKSKEEEENVFMPKLLTPKKEGDSTPVHLRLYADMEKRKAREKVKVEEKDKEKERDRSASMSRIKKNDEPPRYEHLYAMYKESQGKKQALQEKLFKESGASFKPDTSKSNTPKRLRSATPKVPGGILKKAIAEGPEYNN